MLVVQRGMVSQSHVAPASCVRTYSWLATSNASNTLQKVVESTVCIIHPVWRMGAPVACFTMDRTPVTEPMDSDQQKNPDGTSHDPRLVVSTA